MPSASPWIHSKAYDSIFILSPGLMSVCLSFALSSFSPQPAISPWIWLILVVFIDVSHVYSTLFRTYFNKQNFETHKKLYLAIPVLAFLIMCALNSLGSPFFWRVMAYLAAFHFARQQIGFLAIYSRNQDHNPPLSRRFDKTLMGLSIGYPLLYWHTHQRSFNWFIPGDFISLPFALLSDLLAALYLLILFVWPFKEWKLYQLTGSWNTARLLTLLSTQLVWYVGIVFFNSDFIFTLTNIIAHGIPYMGLIYVTSFRDQNSRLNFLWPRKKHVLGGILLFLGIILGLAFIEELLWDRFVWQEHPEVFPTTGEYPLKNEGILNWLVPLLALPQVVHYILDGFIWKKSHPHPGSKF